MPSAAILRNLRFLPLQFLTLAAALETELDSGDDEFLLSTKTPETVLNYRMHVKDVPRPASPSLSVKQHVSSFHQNINANILTNKPDTLTYAHLKLAA